MSRAKIFIFCFASVFNGCSRPNFSANAHDRLDSTESSSENIVTGDGFLWEEIAGLDFQEWAESAMIADKGLLYFGDSVSGSETMFQLKVYDAASRNIIKVQELEHRAHYMAVKSDGEIVVSGKVQKPWWQQFLTTIRRRGGSFSFQSEGVPGEQLFEHFVELGGRIYASEPGAGTILQLSGSTPAKFAGGFSNPGPMMAVNDRLFVLDRGAGIPGDENIVAIDVKTRAIKSKWPQGKGKGQGMAAFTTIAGTDWIAVTEWNANRFIIVDSHSLDTIRSVPTSDFSESIVASGNCVLVASNGQNKLYVHDVKSDSADPIAVVDYSSLATPLRSVRHLVSDPSVTGMTIYLRSVYPWSGGDIKQESSVYRLDIVDQRLLASCGRKEL
jgi:hypothetical protein